MDLTLDQRRALENLARKSKGEDVGWINIANAQALVQMGLCDRDRQGWRVNPCGLAWLLEHGGAASPPVAFQVIPLHQT